MDELSMAFILLSIAVIVMLLVSIYKDHKQNKRKKKRKYGAAAFFGILLILFGLYELPWGAMELYKITEIIFGFDLLQNYLFWTLICCLSIAIGYVLYKKGRIK